MSPRLRPVARSQTLVLSRGLRELEGYTALVGADGSLRLLADLTADPDRPEIRPREAYLALLTSLRPGWTLRFLQVFWPDPLPRSQFQAQAQAWPKPDNEGLTILHQGLLLHAATANLPFYKRTILEFAFFGEKEAAAWWSGISSMLAGYGFGFQPLDAAAVEDLIHWLFNPVLEG